jgi:hypothetical protein
MKYSQRNLAMAVVVFAGIATAFKIVQMVQCSNRVKKTEAKLDDRLDDTFPASDPVAVY